MNQMLALHVVSSSWWYLQKKKKRFLGTPATSFIRWSNFRVLFFFFFSLFHLLLFYRLVSNHTHTHTHTHTHILYWFARMWFSITTLVEVKKRERNRGNMHMCSFFSSLSLETSFSGNLSDLSDLGPISPSAFLWNLSSIFLYSSHTKSLPLKQI